MFLHVNLVIETLVPITTNEIICAYLKDGFRIKLLQNVVFYTQSRSGMELLLSSIFQHLCLRQGNHFTSACLGADLIENFASRLILMKANGERAKEDPLKLWGHIKAL